VRKALGALFPLTIVLLCCPLIAQAAVVAGPADTETTAENENVSDVINEQWASLWGKDDGPAPSTPETASCGTIEFFGPLAVINQHPPNLLFLSPVPERALVLPDGSSYLKLKLDWTNVIIRELDSGIVADYDFETIRTTLDYHRGWGGGEASIRVPYMHRGHGLLDNAISTWHGWFGLPNGLRTKFPDYQYRYLIVSREGLVYNDEGDRHGLGDVVLGYKYPLDLELEGGMAAVRTAVKLPLGDPDSAFGSGSVDYQLGALYEQQLTPHWRAYFNADWVFIGEPDWENVGYQDTLTTLWAVEYALEPGTSLVAQFRTQRNALRIGSFEADKDAQELALGFNLRLNDNLVWSGGFNEDINPETSPDFVVMTNLMWDW